MIDCIRDCRRYSGNSNFADTALRAANVTATGMDKVYDGNSSDAGATLAVTGILPGDNVSFVDTSALFGDKNVGTTAGTGQVARL